MSKLFAILWRLSILVLPWQTRWIFVEGKIGGFSWEQGTVSFYVSWVPMIFSIAVAAWMSVGSRASGVENRESSVGNRQEEDDQTGPRPHDARRTTHLFLKIALALILIASVFTTSLQATLVWWMYALIIGGFVWALVAMRVPRRAISAWLVIAMLPHAVLGIRQFFAQMIPASSILGIALHDPTKSGTSVVEHGLYRVLRAYGGLPHPNIFGGWIALSLAALPELMRSARTKFATYGWLAAGFLLVAALVYTFSRGAWIAAVLAFAGGSVIAFFASRERADRQAVALLAVVCALVAGFGLWSQWDHVVARAQASEHLEQWSLLSRTESFVQGWEAFVQRPIAGWGPGAADVGIIEARKGTAWAVIPPEPPHAAPAVFILETGVLGIAALAVIVVFIFSRRGAWDKGQGSGGSNKSRMRRFFGCLSLLDARLPSITALVVIALTDHYLVTVWAGIALLGVSVAAMLGGED